MATIITKNTTWSGKVVLDGDYQIADGVTLTISPGSDISTSSYARIQVFGSFTVAGEPLNKATIADISIRAAPGTSLIEIRNANIYGNLLGSIGTKSATLIVEDSYFEDSYIQLTSWKPGSQVIQNIFNNSRIFHTSEGIEVSYNLFYGAEDLTVPDIGMNYVYDGFVLRGNSFLNDRVAIGFYAFRQSLDASSNWFGTTDLKAIEQRVEDVSDDLYNGEVNLTPVLSSAHPLSPTVPSQFEEVLTQAELSVIVTPGVLAATPIYLEGLTEKITKTKVDQIITSHTITFGDLTFNYQDVDKFIQTVTRDDEFTNEFQEEISELLPSFSHVSYSDVVKFASLNNISLDSVLIGIAGADSNYSD